VADVNGDGRPDLAVANNGGGAVTVLLGDGTGAFRYRDNDPAQGTFRAGSGPDSVAVADFNGDGRPDLAVTNDHDGTVSVLLGSGNGSFSPATPASGVQRLRSTPYLADLDGDGLADSLVLDRSGAILFRAGLPGNRFAPPVVLNPDRPARDLTVLRTGAGWAAAAVDAPGSEPTLAPANLFPYRVSLYTLAPGGSATRKTIYTGTRLPTRLAAADLSGSGRDDLVMANAQDGTVSVAFQVSPGVFADPLTLPAGVAPSDLALVDVDGDGRRDIVASDQAEGVVTVLYNDAARSFAAQARFRAGTGSSHVVPGIGSLTLSSPAQPVSLAEGDFTGSGGPDLVVVNRGTHSFSVLPNDGTGGWGDPRAALTTSTGGRLHINDRPGPVVAGDFNQDGNLDLAILMEDAGEVWVYTGRSDGTFTQTSSIPVGGQVTGLSVVPGDGPGLLDLLVGNDSGDVLRLVGKGDGTFRPFSLANAGSASAPFALADINGDGVPDVVLVNGFTDQLVVGLGLPGNLFSPSVVATGSAGLLRPTAVRVAQLNRDGRPAVIVVNGGGNNIQVYNQLGVDSTGAPTFAPPLTYFVGTDPVGLTVDDIDGDGVPDILVPDQGSNDIAVLLGSLDADGHWAGTPGLRLNAGGFGPVAVNVGDESGDGIKDLVVLNGQSGRFTVLPGVGRGFFNDQDRQDLPIPGNPGSILSATDGFLLTGSGAILEKRTFKTVFTSDLGERPVSITEFEFPGTTVPALLVGQSDGSLALLTSSTGDEYTLARVVNTGSQPPASLADVIINTVLPVPPGANSAGGSEARVRNDLVALPMPSGVDSGSPVAGTQARVTLPAISGLGSSERDSAVPSQTAPGANGVSASSGSGSQAGPGTAAEAPGGVPATPSSGAEAFFNQGNDALPSRSDLSEGEPGGAGTTDLLSAVDLAAAMLTGGRPVPNLMPRPGTVLPPPGTILPGDAGDEAPAANGSTDEDPAVIDFVIGLDDTIHRPRRAPAVDRPGGRRDSEPRGEEVAALDRIFLALDPEPVEQADEPGGLPVAAPGHPAIPYRAPAPELSVEAVTGLVLGLALGGLCRASAGNAGAAARSKERRPSLPAGRPRC
jgi:hypothetical protein